MNGIDSQTLIRTKLQRPRLGPDLIKRPHLTERLNHGLESKLILISAQAGAGKTTLLAQWLETCSLPSAWISLDTHDNDLMVFVGYVCAAIRTVFPGACEQTLGLLTAPQAPPPRIITTLLVNEMADLFSGNGPSRAGAPGGFGLILALDDYQSITEAAIHELVSELITYLPGQMHLALTSRTDPPLPLAGLRARKEMVELRTNNLRFTEEEARAFLALTAGQELSRETVNLLEDKTEGWAVGLRLAALSVRQQEDAAGFVRRFRGTSSAAIVDYLVSEVLAQQPAAHQAFLLRTAILDRFNAELCDVILRQAEGGPTPLPAPDEVSAETILHELEAANLFMVRLDHDGRWFRFHHLFRDLLQLRLQQRYGPEEIVLLHLRASRWFEEKGFIDEALDHAFASGDINHAVQVLARQRHRLLNQTQWQRLGRYLRRFPAKIANQNPELLMLKAWLVYHQGHYAHLPAVLERLEVAVSKSDLPAEAARHLQGEMSALHSLLSYYQTDVEGTIAAAEFSIENTPPNLWIVRILARLFLAGAMQMKGDLKGTYETVYGGADEESVQSDFFRATLLVSVCSIYWVAADLHGLRQTAAQAIELSRGPQAVEMEGYGHYHLGRVYYERNELERAEAHFATVVQRPYVNYGDCFADSAYGLALTYLAQGRGDDARKVTDLAVAHMLETGNMTLLPVAQAFQAEIALRLGHTAVAEKWANQWTAHGQTVPPLSPMVRLFRPHLALAKTWMAGSSLARRRRAGELLQQLREYTEFTHNTVTLMEVLACMAMLRAAENDEPAALILLEEALALGLPGGFVRLFVDWGPPMIPLLQRLRQRGFAQEYIGTIVAAFPQEALDQEEIASSRHRSSPALVEPLTVRESEILELLAERLTNKEIAAKLFISPTTVKSHTLNIYSKLGVHGRRQAVHRARELGLLPQA